MVPYIDHMAEIVRSASDFFVILPIVASKNQANVWITWFLDFYKEKQILLAIMAKNPKSVLNFVQ